MNKIVKLSGGSATSGSSIAVAQSQKAFAQAMSAASGLSLSGGYDLRIQLRRDTSANWLLADPVIGDGEIAIATDLRRRFKVGDGVAKWSELEFADQSTIDSVMESIEEVKGIIEDEVVPPHYIGEGQRFYVPPTKQVVISDSRLILDDGARLVVDGKLLWAGGGGTRWEHIEGKPSEYRPSYHTHEMQSIIGLEASLNNKVPLEVFKPWFEKFPAAASVADGFITAEFTPGLPVPYFSPQYAWEFRMPPDYPNWGPYSLTNKFNLGDGFGTQTFNLQLRGRYKNILGEVISSPIDVDCWGIGHLYLDGVQRPNPENTVNGVKYNTTNSGFGMVGTNEIIVSKRGFFDLIIAGCGGGGGYRGGGGAGGQVIHSMIYLMEGSYSVTTGSGGTGGTTAATDGTAGGDTVLAASTGQIKLVNMVAGTMTDVSEIRALGGAPGAAQGKTVGIDGPNGGGAPSATASAAIYPGGASTVAGGFAGGEKPLNRLNSGGGGAGAGGAGLSSASNNIGGKGGAPFIYGGFEFAWGGGGYGSTTGGAGGGSSSTIGRGMTNSLPANGMAANSGMGGGAGGNGATGTMYLLARKF